LGEDDSQVKNIMDPAQILDVIDKGGSVAIIIIVATGLWKKELVLGWVYRDLETQCAELRTLLASHASRTEARVDMLEKQRDERYGSSS
jgi:hypothetical protein